MKKTKKSQQRNKRLSKALGNIKKNQLESIELKYIINKIKKNSADEFISRMEGTEERILWTGRQNNRNYLIWTIEKNSLQKTNKIFLQDLWNYNKRFNICFLESLEEEEKEWGQKNTQRTNGWKVLKFGKRHKSIGSRSWVNFKQAAEIHTKS